MNMKYTSKRNIDHVLLLLLLSNLASRLRRNSFESSVSPSSSTTSGLTSPAAVSLGASDFTFGLAPVSDPGAEADAADALGEVEVAVDDVVVVVVEDEVVDAAVVLAAETGALTGPATAVYWFICIVAASRST